MIVRKDQGIGGPTKASFCKPAELIRDGFDSNPGRLLASLVLRSLPGKQKALQVIGVHRLRTVMIETCGQRTTFVVLLSPAGQGDQRNVFAPGLESNSLRDFVAT